MKRMSVRIQWRYAVAAVTLGFVLILTQTGQGHLGPEEPLNFFKNYFVTGDYVVGGVDLEPVSGKQGFLRGTTPMSGVPDDAEILAAFLYWEMIVTGFDPVEDILVGSKFRDVDISTFAKLIGEEVLSPATAPCWSSGGGSNATYTLRTFRADVLRLLPIGGEADVLRHGRHLVNDGDLDAHIKPLHTVELPDAGAGNKVPSSAGATLVVTYRDPNDPLTAIVIFDGLHIKGPDEPTMTQTLQGFYQASGPVGKLTHIVGSSAPNATEVVTFNGEEIATNPFVGPGSPGSDRGWDNPTFAVTVPAGDVFFSQEFTTTVDHGNISPYDCLAHAAIIFSTPVQDTDEDGLLDIWETANTLTDPYGVPLPDLVGMGTMDNPVGPFHKDLFVEIGYMFTDPTTAGFPNGLTYGGVEKPHHTHLPTPAALLKVGDAFFDAPVPINVHLGYIRVSQMA